MFSRLKKRFTYANVAMTLALVFAMTGGAYAAGKYLITSTKQIKPSVLASLKGKAGANGAPGAQGPAGPAGKEGPAGKGETGKEGPEGKEGKEGKTGTNGKEGRQGPEGNIKATLVPGQMETGTWSFSVNTTLRKALVPISFPIPLAGPIESRECSHNPPGSGCHIFLVNFKETGTGACEGGTVEKPVAKAGSLCIYRGSEEEEIQAIESVDPAVAGGTAIGATGVVLKVTTGGTEGGEDEGTWAVTAE